MPKPRTPTERRKFDIAKGRVNPVIAKTKVSASKKMNEKKVLPTGSKTPYGKMK